MYDEKKGKELYLKIIIALEKRNLKKYQFAEMIGIKGSTFCDMLSRLKKGKISLKHFPAISKELGIDFGYKF